MADALSKWWDEDAERINKMAIAARKMAVKLPTDKEDRAWCPTGPGGGTDNSCGSKQGGAASIDYDKLIDRIASSPDGFTLDVRNVEQPEDGIMVSEFQNDSVRSMRINAATIRTASSAIKVREFIDNNSDLLLGRSDRFLGGWLDGDDFYFDVATRFEPKDAEKALETGRESGQLAVFNLATFNTTYVHYEPGDSRKPKDWDERFERAKSDLGDQGHELEKHGKKTVRSIAYSESQDYSCLDKETTSEQKHSESRHSGEGVEASSVSSISSMGGKGSFRAGGDSRSGVVQGQSGGSSGTVRGQVESRDGIDCGRGPGGIFGPGNKCQDEGSPSDAFGNAIDGVMRSPSSTLGGGGGRVDSGWKKSDEPSVYNAEKLRSNPPAPSLAEVNAVTIFNGRTLSASLKEVGVTLDQAAKACGNLSPESNVVVAHGTLKDVANWIDDPSRATDPESSVTVVSKQPFGGVEDAIGTAATLSRTDDDELLLSYVMFSVAPEAQRDNPIAVARNLYSGVVKSISEAEKAGVEEVGMLAAGSDSNDEYKGYRIWPRLGFDGIIPRSRITPTYSLRLGFFEKYGSNLPDEILSDRAKQEKSEGALTIQSLYDTKEGQSWWEANGGPMAMFLRVGDNEDPGWQRFTRISGKVSDRDILDVIDVEWRAIHGEAEQRGFCPTGEGNGIDNSCGSGGGQMMAPDRDMGSSVSSGGSVSQKPASIRVESDEKLRKSISVIGASSVDEVISLGGGNLRGSHVAIAADPEPDGTGSTYVQVITTAPVERDNSSAETFNTQVSISVGPNGKEVGLESLGLSGHGSMTKANEQKVMSLVSEKVIESIATAERLDFDRITTFAIGDSKNGYKGYRLWPQFGFDGDIPRDIVKKIPPELILASKGINPPPPGSTSIPHDLVVKSLASHHRDLTIQELLKTREGDRWWDQNGDDIVLKLDLRDKSSLGYKRWKDMESRLPRLKERNQTREFFDALVEERGFCPTGEGGGIDNSCGNDDGGPTDAFGGSIGGFARTGAAKGGKAPPVEPDVDRPPHNDRVSSLTTQSLFDGTENLDLPKVRGSVPEETMARALTQRAIAAHGGTPIDIDSPMSESDLEATSDALARDTEGAYERTGKHAGWYSEDVGNAIEIGASLPGNEKIATDPVDKFVFTFGLGILSAQNTVPDNYRYADGLYRNWKQTGSLIVPEEYASVLGRGINTSHFKIMQGIVDQNGWDETMKWFSQADTVKQIGEESKVIYPGDKPLDVSGEHMGTVVPRFAVFGPKLGAFTHAVVNGNFDHLVMDRWTMRQAGALTGTLLTETSPHIVSKNADTILSHASDVPSGSELWRGGSKRSVVADLKRASRFGFWDRSGPAWDFVNKTVRAYAASPNGKGGGFGDKTPLNLACNNAFKNKVQMELAPSSGTVANNVREMFSRGAAKTGASNILEVQALGWGDTQKLWQRLGYRLKTEPDNNTFSYAGSLLRDGKSPRITSLAEEAERQKAEKANKKSQKRSADDIRYDYDSDWAGMDGIGDEPQLVYDESISSEGAIKRIVDHVSSMIQKSRSESISDSASALESAKNTVVELRSAGLTTIVMQNAGREGLHVMGFDADIPKDIAETLPETLSHCKTLLDLHVSSEGRSWWEQNGRDIDVAIDLEGVQGQVFDGFATGKTFSDIIEEGILDDYGNS